MSSKYLRRYKVPEGFEEVIEELTKEILKNQPSDIVDFAVEYFRCLQEGLVLDYRKKGKKLPYRFKPTVPRLTRYKYSLSLTQSNQFNMNTSSGFDPSYQEICKTTEGFNLHNKSTELKEVIIAQTKDTIAKREVKQLPQNNGTEKVIEAQATEAVKVKETSIEAKAKKEQFGNKLNYIDLSKKEAVLNDLKAQNAEEIEQYIAEIFLPNKMFTNLVIKAQTAIAQFYKTQHKPNASDAFSIEYDAIIKEITSFPEISSFFDSFSSMSMKAAIDSFKLFPFFQQMLLCYVIKLSSLMKGDTSSLSFLNEFCYFLLGPSLKELLNEPAKKLKDKPWIPFFKLHVLYLQPEVYELFRTSKVNSIDFNYMSYTKFPIRTRELFKSIYAALSLDVPKKQLQKDIEQYEVWYYNTSLEQINAKIASGKDVFTDEECEAIASKIEKASKKIWQLLTGILNMPLDAMDEFIWRYKDLEPLEQEIIINFLQLKADYAEIEAKFSSIPKSTDEVRQVSMIKHLCDYAKLGSEDELEKDIIEYQFRAIEQSISDDTKGIMKDLSQWKNEKKGSVIEKLSQMSHSTREVIYHLLQIPSKENSSKEGLIDLIKTVQAYSSVDSYIERSIFLNDYFSRDSVEYECFIEELNQWKTSLPLQIKKHLEVDRKEQLAAFDKLPKADQLFAAKMYKLLQLTNETEDEELSLLITEAEKHIKASVK